MTGVTGINHHTFIKPRRKSMSESTVVESGVSTLSAEKTNSNPFAVGIGNLLTGSNPEKAIGDSIDRLVEYRKNWESK
jgi:hypothetical protein